MSLKFPGWTNADRCRCNQCWEEYRIRQRANLPPRPEPLRWTLDYAGEWAPVYVEPDAWRSPGPEQQPGELSDVAAQYANQDERDGSNAAASAPSPLSGAAATEAVLPPSPPRLSPSTTPPLSPLSASQMFPELPPRQSAPTRGPEPPSPLRKSAKLRPAQDDAPATAASGPARSTSPAVLQAVEQVAERRTEQKESEREGKEKSWTPLGSGTLSAPAGD
ncbi:hypothetical protein PpBr36_03894 [Pyricularia pennisetigena]|uniref:hypothetical protein n=1 Tax=Pyricularia pennisetigena TaxID=1578925 RepID=UPI0011533802|nr:hypothetical protein PpBr36_03894 [Pyricularia pennisetigena]TLS30810.1 hypothetical protein PpBr36_03894 [Pyricularia pennisetigena]